MQAAGGLKARAGSACIAQTCFLQAQCGNELLDHSVQWELPRVGRKGQEEFWRWMVGAVISDDYMRWQDAQANR